MSEDIFASGVCIVRDDKILAHKRVGGKGYGFPCGKVDEGEHPLFAAVRECFEETGHVAVVTGPNYVGEDDAGKRICIYLATSVAEGEPTHPEEGEAIWVSPKILIGESAWPEYNKSVLARFMIDWE